MWYVLLFMAKLVIFGAYPVTTYFEVNLFGLIPNMPYLVHKPISFIWHVIRYAEPYMYFELKSSIFYFRSITVSW